MKLYDWADKQFMKKGYRKIRDNTHGVYYEKHEDAGNYDHVIAIIFKANGKHIIQSYDKEVKETSTGYHMNEVAGMEISLLFAAYWKARKKLKKWDDFMDRTGGNL